jgi:hypothetical protein
MAGHWIPWEKGLARKPEILRIARTLGVTPLHASAACMLVWEWADDVTIDGLVAGIGVEDVDAACGVPGMGDAMTAVGWIVLSESCIQFPHWERFNGKSAKARFLHASRQRAYRTRQAETRAVKRDARVTQTASRR